MNGLNPYNYPDLYKCVMLGSLKSPGKVTLSGHDRKANWDIQSAKGTTGASSKLNGEEIVQFQASFYLAADEDDEIGNNDFTRWDEFQDLIDSMTSGPTPIALPIYHPDLCRNRITEVSRGSVGGMIHDDRGGATVVVTFVEYKPPKAKATAGAKAKPAGRTGTTTVSKPDPNAERKRQLAALTDEARKP
jgi:hypothetical protein